MENRLSHLFLTRKSLYATCISAALMVGEAARAEKIDTEFFEIGANLGVVTVQDFTSEVSWGLNSVFAASEDFFLQFNYFSADISVSAAEEDPELPFSGDRNYQHFNILLGGNVFQGEIFRGSYAGLSSVYLVAGVGDTEFLEKSSFTWVYGVGYQLALSRRYTLRFDYRNYRYDFTLTDEYERSMNDSQLSLGLNWLF